jgi:WD40 repeat protein
MGRAAFLGWLLAAGVASAADQPIQVITLDRKEPVVYEKDIEPILRAKCTVCHSGKELKGKFDAGSYAGVMKGSGKGPVVIPGKSAESPLIQYVGKTRKPFMPPKDEEPLTPKELALLKLWIDQGAKPPSAVTEKPPVKLSTLPKNIHPVHAVALTPNSSEVIVGRGHQLHVFEVNSGKHLRTLVDPELKEQAAHRSLVESLAVSPDGKWLASGSFQEVLVWDLPAGTIKHRLTGFAHNVMALAFAPKNNLLACGGGAPTEDGELKIYDVTSGALVRQIMNAHSDTIYGVSFNADGKWLASCGADKFVKVHEVATGQHVRSLEGHTHHVLDVAWRSDGKLLASAGADNTIKVWDFETGEQRRTINGHGKQVTRLVFVGQSPQIVTTSGDHTLRMWNVDNGSTVRQFGSVGDFLYAVSASPDGKLVVAGGHDGIARIYDGTNGKLLRELKPPEPAAPLTTK